MNEDKSVAIPNELKVHIDLLRVKRAPNHNAPQETDAIYDPGDDVLFWR